MDIVTVSIQPYMYISIHTFVSSYLKSSTYILPKVDDSQSGFCSIGVSTRKVSTLEDLWRCCMLSDDMKQHLIETVFPRDRFDVDIEVSIDGKEYEACCKRLKKR